MQLYKAIAIFTSLITTASCCSQNPLMSSPTPDNLQVHIEAADQPSTVKVTIKNTHSSSPLTILTWDAPFDSSSRNTGAYHIQPTTKGADELQSLGLKINRMLPAPREDILEIPAGEKVTRDLELKSQWIPTDGQTYKVWANGPWRAVWKKKAQDVTDEDLRTILGDFDIKAKYETNVAEVVLK